LEKPMRIIGPDSVREPAWAIPIEANGNETVVIARGRALVRASGIPVLRRWRGIPFVRHYGLTMTANEVHVMQSITLGQHDVFESTVRRIVVASRLRRWQRRARGRVSGDEVLLLQLLPKIGELRRSRRLDDRIDLVADVIHCPRNPWRARIQAMPDDV